MREKDWQGRWQRALALLNEMAGVKLEPTIICYSTSISAREGAVAAGVGDDEAKEVAQVDVARAEEEVEEARELETAVWDEGDTKGGDAEVDVGNAGAEVDVEVRAAARPGEPSSLRPNLDPKRRHRRAPWLPRSSAGHGRPGLRNLP
ncbi:unnamed protein product [Prorocentrum cordatum]|uniref:Pentatricopeptide repeat-containing protein n=1 Tax=Prorocentrum cordatum TaxID=2364126 RepID=A0ABN9QW17_9DINO|nr:unnamed protein product [Polarella glacialis]